MGVRSDFRLRTVRVLRTGSFPLGEDEELNLFKISNVDLGEFSRVLEENVCGSGIEIRYDSEFFHAVYVRVGRVSFRIFRNGSVCVYGVVSKVKQERILAFFFRFFCKKGGIVVKK